MHVRELEPELSAEAAALRLSTRPGLAWLDAGGAERSLPDARFSFVTCDPVAVWASTADDHAPLAFLDALPLGESHDSQGASASDVPFRAADVPRHIGYLAYDAHFRGQPRRRSTYAPGRAPAKLACFARYAACLVFDHASQRVFVAGDDRAACERLRAHLTAAPRTLRAQAGPVMWPDPEQHARAIAQALEHIARGDIYQVNLARELRASFDGDALALALAMRAQSAVPLGCYLHDGERAIVGRSMERFLRFEHGSRALITRPIKGTLARGGDAAHDELEARALTSDPKERAEHSMIVDLMRNDLSRVAQLGSVRVTEVMQVERYAKLSHLVSTVACTVRRDATLRELVEATFPPGSVTGAPKLRAMQIIEALESSARGVYTGAYGFVDRAGGLSLAVAIRTATVEQGEARYFTGGGIVEASDAAREIAETELKARVFCDALRTLGPSEPSALSRAPVMR
jgi:anthranilate/para-aminobenzoate synthase component I